MPFPFDHRRAVPLLCLALLTLAGGSVRAAEVQVGVTTTAIDIGHDFVSHSASAMAGPVQGTPPLLTLTTNAQTGIVASNAFAAADAFTGEIHAAYSAFVNIDENPRAGRGGSASGSAYMAGGITLTGAAPPGLATFTAIVEGSYNFGNSVFRFNNQAHIDFWGIVDSVYHGVDSVDFDPFSSAGLFSHALTWTVPVQPGQRIDMSFYLHSSVASVVTGVTLDMLNTFKLASMELPPGYGFVPDADGFLSQFPAAPVPEPASVWLLLAGGMALLWYRRGSGRVG